MPQLAEKLPHTTATNSAPERCLPLRRVARSQNCWAILGAPLSFFEGGLLGCV